jgi:hypothetical protein
VIEPINRPRTEPRRVADKADTSPAASRTNVKSEPRHNPGAAGPRDYSLEQYTPGSRSMPEPRWDAISKSADPGPAPRARRVNIQFGGPAIGTAPHYLAYAVDLPAHVVEGADFLWMDNGVWMGDEPRGVRILDTPGLHRISVLVITRNNEEYRGAATVQILDRGASTSAGQVGDR